MLVLEQNHIPDGHATAKDLVSPLEKTQEHSNIFDSVITRQKMEREKMKHGKKTKSSHFNGTSRAKETCSIYHFISIISQLLQKKAKKYKQKI